MRALRLALAYTLRSLRRGGARSLLAVFCIAVGVMAVVALRLAGSMISLSLTANVRDVLGGDVSLQSTAVPLDPTRLGPLDALRAAGRIQAYITLGTERASLRLPSGRQLQVQAYIVDDPARFPLVGGSDVTDPAGAPYAQLLTGRGAVVSRFAADELHLGRGGTTQLTLQRGGGGSVTVAGVRGGNTAGNPAFVYLSRALYQALSDNPAHRIGVVDILQPDAATAAASAARLRLDYPEATVQTVQDVLDQNIDASTQISRFLEITGLLALLIGGTGVANTMQVALRRRRVEIAMLKATGYRRRDLYALFGLEAGLLGLCGGLAGAALGIGVAAVVRLLVARAFLLDIVFSVQVGDVLTGLAVGVVTALIFGLIPIARAAAVRPAEVLRDSVTPTRASVPSILGLRLVVVALFTALAASLIGSLVIALWVVVGALVLLGVLTGVFWVAVTLVGRIPVPERPSWRWLAGSVLSVAAGLAAAAALGPIGDVLLVLAVAATGLVAVPRRVKSVVKLGLRSLGRARGRTSTTVVALFVGVFVIGLIVVIGTDIGSRINQTLDSLSGFNVVAVASPSDAATVRRVTAQLPGVDERRVTVDIAAAPVTVDGRPLADVEAGQPAPRGRDRGESRVSALAGVEGYQLGAGQTPDVLTLFGGAALDRSQAGGSVVLVRSDLRNAPFHLRVGSRITLRQPTSGAMVDLVVGGFYVPARVGSGGLRIAVVLQPVLADVSVVDRLAGPGQNADLQTTVAMHIDAATKSEALRQLESQAPQVYVLDIADFAALVQQFLSNLVVLLVALASLSVFAGLVIIANAVALAMLERRREVGILKSVGHSATSVLGQVLVENAAAGAIAAVAGMVMVTVATRVLTALVLTFDLPVPPAVVLGGVAGTVVLVAATAAAVAWGPTRARPLEVLRYE